MTDPQPNATAKPRKRSWFSRLLRTALWGVSLLVVAMVIMGGTGLYLLRTPPDYWKTIDTTDPQVQAKADEVFNRVMSQVTEVRDPRQTWQMQVDEEDVNAWLATRAKDWMQNQGYDKRLKVKLKEMGLPPEIVDTIRNPMVSITDERVAVAAEITYQGLNQVVSVEFEKERLMDGTTAMTLGQVKGGTLPIPIRKLRSKAKQKFGSEAKAEAVASEKLSKTVRRANIVLPVDEHRSVKLADVKLAGGKATLVCQTIMDADQ